jgi:hypothetical protein
MHFGHFNFDFSTHQIIWTLTLAALLVLLVVLYGRERARRYPWFTAGIALFALQLMAEELLAGRMAVLPLQIVLISLANLSMIVGLLVVVEVARRAFAGLSRSLWLVNAAGLLVVSGGILAAWGPWLPWSRIAANPSVTALNLMLIAAAPKGNLLVVFGVDKGNLLVSLLLAETGFLVVLFGRKFKGGWRSHTQMISIGLSTVALSWLAVQGVWAYIVRTAHPASRAEHDQIMSLAGKMVNGYEVIYLAVLVWWIVWLWLDEPGMGKAESAWVDKALAEPLASKEPPPAGE